jgi:Predicted glutamine amidotransferases
MGGEGGAPWFYGGTERDPGSGRHYPSADASQIPVICSFGKMNKPVPGNCRGLQLINVALGVS